MPIAKKNRDLHANPSEAPSFVGVLISLEITPSFGSDRFSHNLKGQKHTVFHIFNKKWPVLKRHFCCWKSIISLAWPRKSNLEVSKTGSTVPAPGSFCLVVRLIFQYQGLKIWSSQIRLGFGGYLYLTWSCKYVQFKRPQWIWKDHDFEMYALHRNTPNHRVILSHIETRCLFDVDLATLF